MSLHISLRGWPASRERRGRFFDEVFLSSSLRPSDARTDGRYYDTVCISGVKKEEWKYNPASERMKEPHRQHLEKNGKTIALFFSLIKGMFCSLPVWINCITTFEHLITFHSGCNISALSPGNCVMNNAAWLPAVIFLITWQRWKYQRRLGESSFQHP